MVILQNDPASLLIGENILTIGFCSIPQISLRRCEALRLLDGHQLPGGLRYVRLQRDPLQPRKSSKRRNVRYEKDHQVLLFKNPELVFAELFVNFLLSLFAQVCLIPKVISTFLDSLVYI
jgi:hypothetical protein